MSRLVYVDVVGGAAGDMLLAALLDAGAPQEPVQEAVDAVLPGRFRLQSDIVARGCSGSNRAPPPCCAPPS